MLELYRLILRFEMRKVARFFATRTLAKSIVSIALVLVFCFVASSLFFFFLSAFYFLERESVEGIHAAISLFVYEIFLLSIALLTVISSAISIIFNLFKRTDENWVLASPSYAVTGLLALFRAVRSSLFVCAIVFVPALFAFAYVYSSTWYEMTWILFCIMFMIIGISSAAYSAIILFGKFYAVLSSRISWLTYSFTGLVTGVATVFLLGSYGVWGVIRSVDLVELFKAESTEVILDSSVVGNHFMWSLTHLVAKTMLAIQERAGLYGYVYGVLLAMITVLVMVLAYMLTPYVVSMWVRFQEHTSYLHTKKTPYIFTGTIVSVLTKKEMLLFVRNIRGLLWFFFLIFIWVVQIGTSTILEKNITRQAVQIFDKTLLVRSIEFAIAMYFVSSFALRFVFPSFSIEKRAAWILETAPYTKIKIFISKFVFYVVLFITLALLMNTYNSIVLGVSFADTISMYSIVCSSVIGIVMMSLTFGVLFPSYETDDPEVMSTSMPGLFLTGLLLSCGFFTAYGLYKVPAQYLSVFALGVTFVYSFISLGLFFFLYKTKRLI